MTRLRTPFGVFLAAVITVLLLLFLQHVAEVLLLFFIAVLFSLYLGAITDFLEERLRVPRAYGLLAALVLTLVFAGVVIGLIVPPLLQQTQDLLVALPALLTGWQQQLRELASRYPLIGQLVETRNLGTVEVTSPLATIGEYFAGLFPYVYTVVHLLILLVSVLVMGIYMTLRPSVYTEGFIRMIPPLHRDLARDILRELSGTLRAWIVGQILAMIFLGVLTWVGLLVLRVPYALAFGVFTGVVVMVPFFGTLVSTLLPALFVLGSQGPVGALLVVLLGVVVHLVEANLVHPVIMERQVHLPPVLSILSVLVMAELLGPVGLVVAVPTLATAIVVVRRIYVERILEGGGFRKRLRRPRREEPHPAAPAPDSTPLVR